MEAGSVLDRQSADLVRRQLVELSIAAACLLLAAWMQWRHHVPGWWVTTWLAISGVVLFGFYAVAMRDEERRRRR